MMWRRLVLLLLLHLPLFFSEESGVHKCLKGQFSCGDGICIEESWRCDREGDCASNLDEKDCPNHESCKKDEFNCGNNSLCIPMDWKCDKTSDCPFGEDERPEVCSLNAECGQTKFSCGDGTCIPSLWVCDGHDDCLNARDEDCSETTCPEMEFRCANGKCVPKEWRCDGDSDCSDKSDELNCKKNKTSACDNDQYECGNGVCIFKSWRCDGSSDCEDHSDELKCTASEIKSSIGCSVQDFSCADGEQCIHSSWRCDGDDDCLDASDEVNCTHTCQSDDFLCDNNECVSMTLRCDGEVDCLDATDEQNCTSPTTTVVPSKTCEKDTFGCETPTGWQCLDGSKVCDGVKHCKNFEDEDNCPSVPVDPCKENNGGCLQLCVKEFRDQHRCECHKGFVKMGNNSCEDVNECAGKERLCSQRCINTKGSYHCSCVNGYVLERKTFCRVAGKRPKLLIANRYDIHTLELDSWEQYPWLEGLSSTVSVDFDYQDQYLFWSDVALEKIFRARKLNNGTIEDKLPIVHSDVKTPDGIAVDWIYNHLYWTDAGNDRIEVSNYDGTMRKSLINFGLDEPRAIVVDPIRGWMYWSDWGKKPKIARCGMNGKFCDDIITQNLEWPNGLTLDFVDQKLFWIDAKLNSIMTADVDGKNQRTVLHNAQYIQHPFAIAVFEDNLYWSDWSLESIRTINKFRGDGFDQVALGLHSPMDIHVYHEKVQHSGTNYCGQNNGGCTHLCLPAPETKAAKLTMIKTTCACPNGFNLFNDGKSCVSDITTVTTKTTVHANVSILANVSTTTKHPNRVPFNATSATTLKVVTSEVPVSTKVPVSTAGKPFITTESAVITGTPVVTTESTANKTTTTVTATRPMEQIGLIAGIVAAVFFVLFLVVGISGYFIYQRYTKRNIKSMHFENPVYRKTTEDQFIIPYGRESSQNKKNNPAAEPLTGNPEV